MITKIGVSLYKICFAFVKYIILSVSSTIKYYSWIDLSQILIEKYSGKYNIM